MRNLRRTYLASALGVAALLAVGSVGCDRWFEPELRLDPGYPRWLKNEGTRAEQTSGAAFIGRDERGRPSFLLADDAGYLRRLTIHDDTLFLMTTFALAPSVERLWGSYPRRDFEAIAWDSIDRVAYLSIEGHNPDPSGTGGVYRLFFADDDPFADSIRAVEKITPEPEADYFDFFVENHGFEAIEVDEERLYLGYEGFIKEKVFSDSAIFYVVDKRTMRIERRINSLEFGARTLCGMALRDGEFWFVDRNGVKIVRVRFDEEWSVESREQYILETRMPGYPRYNYISAPEAIAFDDEGRLYVIEDPPKKLYAPPRKIAERLDRETLINFYYLTPIVYRYTVH